MLLREVVPHKAYCAVERKGCSPDYGTTPVGECRHICRTVYIGLVSEVFLVSVVDLYC